MYDLYIPVSVSKWVSENYNNLLSLLQCDDSIAKNEKENVDNNKHVTINDTIGSDLDFEN